MIYGYIVAGSYTVKDADMQRVVEIHISLLQGLSKEDVMDE